LLTPEANTELTELWTFTDSSTKLGELHSQPARIQIFSKMREPMNTIVVELKKDPTVPNCRAWCAQVANALVEELQFRQALRVILIFQLNEEPHYSRDDPAAKRFSLDQPRMWKVTPTDEDEALLEEQATPEPLSPTDKRSWQIQQKFDELTKAFGSQYMRWFAGEALFKILETDMSKATEFCEILIEMLGEADALGQLKPVTETIRACSTVATFGHGYLAVTSYKPFSEKSYAAFVGLFIERAGPEGCGLKTLGNGARKNAEFNALYFDVSQRTSYEQDNHDKIMDFFNRLAAPTEFDDLTDLGAIMKEYRNEVRGSCYEKLANGYVELLLARSENLMHPSNMTTTSEKHCLLRSLASELVNLSEYALSSKNKTDRAQISTKLSIAIQQVSGQLAAEKITEQANEIDDVWIKSESFLTLIVQLKAVSDHAATLEKIGVAQVFALADMWPAFDTQPDGDVEQQESNMFQLLENFKAMATKMAAVQAPHSIDAKLLNTVMARGLKVFKQGKLWKESVSNGDRTAQHFVSLNRAYMEWRGCEGVIPSGSPAMIELTRSVLLRTKSIRDLYIEQVNAKLQTVKANIMVLLKEHYRYANGTKGGRSWKLGKSAASVDELLAHAQSEKGLLAGPGDFVESTKVAMKQVSCGNRSENTHVPTPSGP
jgi:hypothetical protein